MKVNLINRLPYKSMTKKTNLLMCGALAIIAIGIASCAAPTRFGVYCRQNGGDLKYGNNESEAHCVFPDGSVCDPQAFQKGECRNQAVASINATHQPVSGSGDGLPAPTTSHELLNRASLIFIGEVGPVAQQRNFAGYGLKGEMLDGAKTGNPAANVPYTDFELKVERVIKDDGSIADGKPIILRMAGEATPETKRLTATTDYPFSYTGDRYLFLLAHEPDEIAYGFYYGPWSRLIIDSNNLLYVSNGMQQLLKLDGSEATITLDDFIARIGR